MERDRSAQSVSFEKLPALSSQLEVLLDGKCVLVTRCCELIEQGSDPAESFTTRCLREHYFGPLDHVRKRRRTKDHLDIVTQCRKHDLDCSRISHSQHAQRRGSLGPRVGDLPGMPRAIADSAEPCRQLATRCPRAE